MTGLLLRGMRLLALVAMQVALTGAILYALAAVGNSAAQPARWPELAGLMLAALAASRLLPKQPARLRQALWALGGIPLVLLLLKSMMGGGLAPGAGWERLLDTRIRNAQELVFCTISLIVILRRAVTLPALHAFDLARLFKRQVLTLAAVLLAAPLLQADLAGPAAQAALTGYVLVFMAGALLAIVLGQLPPTLGAARQRRLALGGLLPPALVLALGAALLSIVSPGARGLVVAVAGGLRDLLLVPVALLGIIASGISLGLLSLLQSDNPAPQPTPTPGPETAATPMAELLTDSLAAAPPPPWITAAGYVLTILILIAIAWLALGWLRRPEPAADEPAGERESVWSWRQLADDLRGLAAGLGGRRNRPDGDDPSAAASRVRRAYRGFLRLAAERNRQRQQHQTAREFLPDSAPLAARHSARLTELYEQARYGRDLPPEAAAEAEAAARSIQAEAKSTP